jgi:hypothetical protein
VHTLVHHGLDPPGIAGAEHQERAQQAGAENADDEHAPALPSAVPRQIGCGWCRLDIVAASTKGEPFVAGSLAGYRGRADEERQFLSRSTILTPIIAVTGASSSSINVPICRATISTPGPLGPSRTAKISNIRVCCPFFSATRTGAVAATAPVNCRFGRSCAVAVGCEIGP